MEPVQETVTARVLARRRTSRSESSSAARLRRSVMWPALVLALAFLASCVSDNSIYRWGHYEESVYSVCHGAETIDLAQDVQVLSQELDRAQSEGRRAAPGIHAHLGYLYYLSGNTGAAEAQFEAEKSIYPESAVFIDGMLRRMKS
jgi:hypothetical protein